MIRDNDTDWVEPEIVINGRTLTFVEAMSVRVAVSTFRMTLADPATRKLIGKTLATAYNRHLKSVELSMIETGRTDA